MNWEAEAARKCIYFYASKSPTETSKPNASTFRYIHKHTWILCYKSVHIEHRAVEQMSTILCWDGVFDVNRQRCLVHGAISSNEDDVENAQGSGASESSRVEATKTEWWRMEGISKNMGNGQAFTLSSFIYFISVCFVSFRCWIVRSIPFARTPNPNKRKNAIKEYGLFRSRSRPCERLMCVSVCERARSSRAMHCDTFQNDAFVAKERRVRLLRCTSLCASPWLDYDQVNNFIAFSFYSHPISTKRKIFRTIHD